jgi:hypothetical protein
VKTIEYKSAGRDVDVLQTLLDIPHNPAHEFNETTLNAVLDFQKRNGLEADGIVDYKTWETLFFHDERPKYGISESDFDRAAMLLDCEPAALKAVQRVETGGKGGFLPSGRPTILFEGHIFWQQLRTLGINPKEFASGHEDILYPKWTKAHYKGGEAEYERLLRARQINVDAANASASWGMFQIMGFNHAACGEPSVASFVASMCQSECRQLLLSVRFIRGNRSMLTTLQKKDWKTFARLYNGPAYAQNRYDEKISKTYSSFTKQTVKLC